MLDNSDIADKLPEAQQYFRNLYKGEGGEIVPFILHTNWHLSKNTPMFYVKAEERIPDYVLDVVDRAGYAFKAFGGNHVRSVIYSIYGQEAGEAKIKAYQDIKSASMLKMAKDFEITKDASQPENTPYMRVISKSDLEAFMALEKMPEKNRSSTLKLDKIKPKSISPGSSDIMKKDRPIS